MQELFCFKTIIELEALQIDAGPEGKLCRPKTDIVLTKMFQAMITSNVG